MDAYNYTTQKWETGKAGTELMLTQLRQRLLMLSQPNGAALLQFEGSFSTLAQALTDTREGIAQCEADLFCQGKPVAALPSGRTQAEQEAWEDQIEKLRQDKIRLLASLEQTVSSLAYWFPRHGDPEGANSAMMQKARAAIAIAKKGGA